MADLDGMDEAARKAYAAAQRLIEKTIREGGTSISFDRAELHELTHIPPEIAEIEVLIHLDLNDTKVSDLSPIRNLTNLQNLHLNKTKVSDLSPIRNLTKLQGLYLDETKVSDLYPIRVLTRLGRLELSQTVVRDLSPIRNLTRLEYLWFDQTEVSDLSPIRDLTGLKSLSLGQTEVSDLSPIRNLTKLQMLSFHQTEVSDLSPIRNLTGLESLWLGNTKVNDLSPIRNLTDLQILFLDKTRVSDLRPVAGMEKLGAQSMLNGVWFSNTPAVEMDKKLARLAEIRNDQKRAKETLAYLETLPPWPEPLPWLAKNHSPPPQTPNPQPPRQDPPLTRAMAGPKTPAKHVKFLLSQPRLTEFTAKEVAGQIRWALKDVKRATNSLPEPLATIEEIADALDDLGNTRLGPKDKQRVQDLNLRIAQLEAVVEKLTAQLSDSEKARETAEALAHSQTFAGQLSPELASEIVKTGGFIVRAGIVTGAVYFLGVTSPIVAAMLGALAALK